MPKEKKLPGTVTMLSEEDQKYYDALHEAEFMDINDLFDMRSIAIVRNGQVKYPFYDINMETMAPQYDENDQRISGIEIPHGEILKRNLANMAKDGELYFYREINGKSEPYKINFTSLPDGKIAASLPENSLYKGENKFKAPTKPAGLGLGYWLLNKITFGLAFSGKKRDADEKMRQWEKDTQAHQKMMADREVLIGNKKVRDEEDKRFAERKTGREFAASTEKYQKNLAAFYGPKAKKTGLAIDPAIDMIDPATNYEIPEGFTKDMTIGLVKMSLGDPEIAKLAKTKDDLIQINRDIAQMDDDIEKYFSTVEGHATEDIMSDRIGLEKKAGRCFSPARIKAKEALDEYRTTKNPEKIGKIIGQGAALFANSTCFSDAGMTLKMYVCMKNNAAVLDLMEQHPDILHAAKNNGLTEKTLQSLQAQKALCQIHEKDIKSREKLLTDYPQQKEEKEDALTDYLLGKLADNMIKNQTKERDKALEKVTTDLMTKGSETGKSHAETSHEIDNANAKIMNRFESLEQFDAFGKPGQLENYRQQIKNNALFKETINEMMKDGKNLDVLNNQAKTNRLINSLDQTVINPPKNEPTADNLKKTVPIQDAPQEEKELGGMLGKN